MSKQKSLYGLVLKQEPHTTHTFTNPLSDETFSWTVPENGETLFYIGETTMTIPERHSKHKTYAKKYAAHIRGLDVLDPHLYPVYAFIEHFQCTLEFVAQPLQSNTEDGLTEAEWIKLAREEGHPLQNKMDGSKSLHAKYHAPEITLNSIFKEVNEKNMGKRKTAPQPTTEEIMAAREEWIAKQRKQA